MMKYSEASIVKVIICVLLGCCVTMRVTGSAIPMWEFLSRDEKVSISKRINPLTDYSDCQNCANDKRLGAKDLSIFC